MAQNEATNLERKQIAKFEVTIPKTAKTLAKFVCKDVLRPVMQYVCIEPSKGYITATDAYMLQVMNITVDGELPDGLQILVDPKHIAKVAGKHVGISVFEDVREVEEERTVSRGYFVGSTTTNVKVNRTFRAVEMRCGGETYTTEAQVQNFPDVMRAIPRREGRKTLRLTPESLDALKTICKLHKGDNYITLTTSEGDNRLTVCGEVESYSDSRAAYSLKLAEAAELAITIRLNLNRLSACLTGCNGIISFIDISRPVMFDGDADATILMPVYANDLTTEFANEVRNSSILTGTAFAEDAAAVVADLQHHAAELWQSIIRYNTKGGECGLTAGNYSAKDITYREKAKCGCYVIPYGLVETLTIKHGNIRLTISTDELFAVLAKWEAAVKCQKSVFAVGLTGTADATREIAARIKAQAEEEAKHTLNNIMNMKPTIKEFIEKYGDICRLEDGKYRGNLNLSGTRITSLPDNLTVGGFLDLSGTGITNTDHVKRTVPTVLFWQNGKYIKADGIFSRVLSHHGNAYRIAQIGRDKEQYIVTDGNGKWAHGDTLAEAKEDLKFKISTRDTSKYNGLPLDHEFGEDEAIECYRVVSGACAAGTKHFLLDVLPKDKRQDRYTIAQMIQLTKGQYGAETFRKFFKG